MALSDALYPNGPAEGPVGPNFIDQGKAQPQPAPDQWRGQPVSSLPESADPGTVSPGTQPPQARQPQNLGDVFYPKSDAPQAAADPAANTGTPQQQPAAGDAELMAAFTDTADDLGLGEGEQQRLLALHQEAIAAVHAQHERQVAEWKREAEQAYGSKLAPTITGLRARILAGPEGHTFMDLMRSSGLGSHPAVIRTLERLASGRR